MSTARVISIWFFIGVCLLVTGGLIFAAGLYELAHPPQYPVVLFRLHASVWWGGLLFLLGILYCLRFAPWREKDSGHASPHEESHAKPS